MSRTTTWLYFCRWPVLRRYRTFDLYLKTMTFLPLASRSTSATTCAPATVGCPTMTLSPSATSSTDPRSTWLPGSAAIFSISRRWPGSTRYCLPPVATMAYTVVTPKGKEKGPLRGRPADEARDRDDPNLLMVPGIVARRQTRAPARQGLGGEYL